MSAAIFAWSAFQFLVVLFLRVLTCRLTFSVAAVAAACACSLRASTLSRASFSAAATVSSTFLARTDNSASCLERGSAMFFLHWLIDFSPSRKFLRAASRLGSGGALVLLQLKRKPDVDAARQDREPADQPGDCQRASAGLGKHDNAKGNRQQAAQTEQPLAFDFLAQTDRTPDLQHADDDCPTGDEHQQYQRRHAGPDESQRAGENTGNADNGEPPSWRYLATSAGNRRP